LAVGALLPAFASSGPRTNSILVLRTKRRWAESWLLLESLSYKILKGRRMHAMSTSSQGKLNARLKSFSALRKRALYR